MLEVNELDGFGIGGDEVITSVGFSFPLQAATGLASPGWNGYTIRTIFAAASLSLFGHGYLRIQMAARSGNLQIGKMYVGALAASGHVWDFASTPVQLTAGAATTWTIASGNTSFLTDWVPFSFSSAIVVSAYFNNGSSDDLLSDLNGSHVPTTPNVSSWFHQVDDAATVAPSGYTVDEGNLYSHVYGIEVADLA